ncbi:MAG: diaminopimelate decarboxylase [Dehalococcoidia bacterium]|nr:diaminopimelate decarboxylase [Dehalococcoidia bacterium]
MNNKISLFPQGTTVNSHHHLVIGGQDVTELADKYGTPLYLFDELTIRNRCREFKAEFGKRYANTVVAYASKAFLHKALLHVLREEELWLDVVSGGELFLAETAGFPLQNVYFHGNNKSADELEYALKCHVGRVVVDGMDELHALANLAQSQGITQEILLRVTPGVDPHTHSHIITGAVGSKFGFSLADAREAITYAMTLPCLKLKGIHFHIGSLIYEAEAYLEALDVVLELVSKMQGVNSFSLLELNIGGGFAVPYTSHDQNVEVSYYAEALFPHLMQKCASLHLELPKLTIEPGRSLIAQAGVALYRVGYIKDAEGPVRYVMVDGGMADNIRPSLYDARYEAVLANRMNEADSEKVTIAGRFCESGDKLINNIYLPPVAGGDLLAVPVCGAYCLPLASNYNATVKAPIVWLSSGNEQLIRRRETYQDLTLCDLI